MPNFLVIKLNAANNHYEVVIGPNANNTFTASDESDANGLAALQTKQDGKYVAFPSTDGVAETLEVVQSTTATDSVF